MDHLRSVLPGDLLERGGEMWEVIGFIDKPSLYVQRVGCRDKPADRHVLVYGAPFTEEWRVPDPVMPEIAERDCSFHRPADEIEGDMS